MAEDEIDKLFRHGEGWLHSHPARDLITRRYLKHQGRLTRLALERLETVDASPADPVDAIETLDAIAEPAALNSVCTTCDWIAWRRN